MNTAQEVTYSTYQHMYGLISNAQTDFEKVKGLLIKIKVIKGFSTKLKVSKGFKGSTSGAAIMSKHNYCTIKINESLLNLHLIFVRTNT